MGAWCLNCCCAWGVSDAELLAACIRRLGEPAPKIDLGCRQLEEFTAAQHKLPQRQSVLQLQDVLKVGLAQSVVLAPLQWGPTQRPEIAKLLRVGTTPLADDAALAMSQVKNRSNPHGLSTSATSSHSFLPQMVHSSVLVIATHQDTTIVVAVHATRYCRALNIALTVYAVCLAASSPDTVESFAISMATL